MLHLGSITDIDGADIPVVDVITFGSPCQDLSTARGKRDGLAGGKSSLFHEAIRVISEMRKATHGKYPKIVVWENVTGALHSNSGRDFRAVLQSFTRAEITMPESGRWKQAGVVNEGEIAWNVLDSLDFGVPQRRRRVFVVCDFRKGRAGEILSLPVPMRGDTPANRKVREKVAGSDNHNTTKPICVTGGVFAGGWYGAGIGVDIAPTIVCSQDPVVFVDGKARRLMPVEVERCFGFPDEYTKVGVDGEVISDTARYRMLGNSVAVPVVSHILANIKDVLTAERTNMSREYSVSDEIKSRIAEYMRDGWTPVDAKTAHKAVQEAANRHNQRNSNSEPEPEPKRKPGRPRKNPVQTGEKRARGRPRKAIMVNEGTGWDRPCPKCEGIDFTTMRFPQVRRRQCVCGDVQLFKEA